MKVLNRFTTLKFLLSFILASFLLQITANAAGIVDETFGDNGTTQVNIGTNQVITDVAVQSDDKIIVSGFFFQDSLRYEIFLARYNSDGTIDTTFGDNGKLIISLSENNEQIFDIELQSDGKIIAVGTVPALGYPYLDFLILRCTTDGELDQLFGDNGIVRFNQGQSDRFTKVAIQKDGKIVAAGGSSFAEGLVARFNSDGSFDTEFADGGIYYQEFDVGGFYNYGKFDDVEILQDGKILTGGTVLFTADPTVNYGGYYTVTLSSNGIESSNLVRSMGIVTNTRFRLESFDAEILPDGKVAIADGTGFRIRSADNSSTLNTYPQTGKRIALSSDGRMFVSGGLFKGNHKVYSGGNLIGTAWNIPDGKTTIQSNNKLIVATNNSIIRVKSFTSQGTRIANFIRTSNNFDKDDKTDLAFYSPAGNSLLVLNSNGDSFIRTHETSFTKVFPEFTQVGTGDGSIWRETLVYWENESTNNAQAFFDYDRFSNDSFIRRPWGLSGDIPFGGDFNGNGLLDIGVFRPSEGIWYGLSEIVQWGTVGDKPVPADYDFDGITDYAVYRPSTGTWWILRSSDGGFDTVRFGLENDIPLTGDFDADGKADFTVYRPSEGIWYQLLTTEGFRAVRFGISTDYPVPGDYDGDCRHDIAVFREGIWYLLQSTEGLRIIKWGTSGDIPVAVRYDE